MTQSRSRLFVLLLAILSSIVLFVSDTLFNTVPVAYASCSISGFSVSPGSPQPVGVTVNISGSANCGGGVRAMRILVDGNVIAEIGAPDISATWNTSGAAPGGHNISVEAAENGDNNWSNTASQSTGYDLVAPPPPQCSITSFNVSPGSPQPPGTTITVSGSASCSTGVRAIRIKVNGGVISEIGAQDISATWQAPGPGSYTIEVETAGNGDNSWSHSAIQSTAYDIRQVDPGCTVNSIDASPSSPQPPGTTVTISGSGSCANGSVRAMRIKVDGNVISEIGAPSISASWTPTSYGTHTFTVEVAGQGDNNWAFADSASMSYEIAVVDPRCTITSINATPSSPQPPGTTVSISGSATCANGGVRAMRIRVNGNIISEIGGSNISASWTAPNSSEAHTFTVEAAGNGDNDWAFAASQSIGYEIKTINPGCSVTAINGSPPSPQPPGTTVTISGRASCSNGSVRAMRVRVNGSIIAEIGGPEISASWTAPSTAGTHTFTVEASGQGDNNWALADSQSMSYEIAARPSQCRIDSITTLPASPQPPRTTISITGKASCEGSSVRAVRIRVNGTIISEIGGPELTTDWTTPNTPGTHTITVEAAAQGDNDWSSAASSSVTYETRAIVPQCRVDSVTASPPSPQPPGTRVTISGSASCSTGVRAMRIKVDGGEIYQIGGPNISTTWEAPSSGGSHTFTVEAAGNGDNSWTYAASQSSTYIVSTSSNVVDPRCVLTSLTADPLAPQLPGTIIKIVAKGTCENGVRAIRIKVDGQVLKELGTAELSVDWSSPNSNGVHRIEAEIAGLGDNQWVYTARRLIVYILDDNGIPTESPSSAHPTNGCQYTWSVGNRVALEAGAEIRKGPGTSFEVHTRVPENNWLVDIIGGPREADDGVWFDISRTALDGGGSGWVEFSQTNYSGCYTHQPSTDPSSTGNNSITEADDADTVAGNSPENNSNYLPGPIHDGEMEYQYSISCQQLEQQGVLGSEDGMLDRIRDFFRNLFNIQAQAQEQPSPRRGEFPEGQCTELAANLHPESYSWLPDSGADAHVWDESAIAAGISVDNNPRIGDIVNWESNCDIFGESGHVAYVLHIDSEHHRIVALEQNVPLGAGPTMNVYQIEDCMSFIHTEPPKVTPGPFSCNKVYRPRPLTIEKSKIFGFIPRFDYVLEIPLPSLPDTFEIYFKGEKIPNTDSGIRHDGYHAGISESYQYLGISTLWTWLHSDWEDTTMWEVYVPCEGTE